MSISNHLAYYSESHARCTSHVCTHNPSHCNWNVHFQRIQSGQGGLGCIPVSENQMVFRRSWSQKLEMCSRTNNLRFEMLEKQCTRISKLMTHVRQKQQTQMGICCITYVWNAVVDIILNGCVILNSHSLQQPKLLRIKTSFYFFFFFFFAMSTSNFVIQKKCAMSTISSRMKPWGTESFVNPLWFISSG